MSAPKISAHKALRKAARHMPGHLYHTAGSFNVAQEELDAMAALEECGYAVVPLVADVEMVIAGALDRVCSVAEIYRAMIAARPK